MMKIAIAGRQKDTLRYEGAFERLGTDYVTTLSLSKMLGCDALLLPGGGDITPAFFGQKNAGSKNIDTELDIIQLQALEQALRQEKPVLGICKGVQLINVYFGGTITQHMANADTHQYIGEDQYHDTVILPDNYLSGLYGNALRVNSAHHQCIARLGKDLSAVQFASDSTIEGISHKSLPIYGVQWHPERLQNSGDILLSFFCGLVAKT